MPVRPIYTFAYFLGTRHRHVTARWLIASPDTKMIEIPRGSNINLLSVFLSLWFIENEAYVDCGSVRWFIVIEKTVHFCWNYDLSCSFILKDSKDIRFESYTVCNNFGSTKMYLMFIIVLNRKYTDAQKYSPLFAFEPWYAVISQMLPLCFRCRTAVIM